MAVATDHHRCDAACAQVTADAVEQKAGYDKLIIDNAEQKAQWDKVRMSPRWLVMHTMTAAAMSSVCGRCSSPILIAYCVVASMQVVADSAEQKAGYDKLIVDSAEQKAQLDKV